MVIHRSSLIHMIIIVVTIGIVSFISVATDSSLCEGSCGSNSKPLPYPFGFSVGCPIQLKCVSGDIKIGEFIVKNVTSSSLFVHFPKDCDRSIDRIQPLFGENYGPSSENSFLLQNCTVRSNDCLINPAFVQRQLSLSRCGTTLTRCYTQERNNSDKFGFMNFTDVLSSQCNVSFSSITFNSRGRQSGSMLEFERVQLGWWLPGNCGNASCSSNSECTEVKLTDGNSGYRCSCKEQFYGDGFRDGVGCLRASECHGSKFLSQWAGNSVAILVGGLILGAILMAGLTLMCYCFRRRSASLRSLSSGKRLLFEAAGNSSIPFFPYKEIEKATNNFSDKQRLGTGAYGTVYAGKLQNGEWLAIKRLRHRDNESVDQVKNEIKLLTSVSHPNLVRLLGCCIEEGEPILVYEYMPNGTLSQHLQRERGEGLSWTVRLTIATQTAKAIAYLHSAMNPPIYHRDIKSSNILLDYNFNSKVADFGLSRLGLTETSHISTAPQGTPGYLDPQYHQYFHLSDKSDVYSFGVVLVEIITALKVVDFSRQPTEVNLAALAVDKIGRGCVEDIIDPLIEPNTDAWTLSSIHNVAELAFRCLAFHGDMRPTMLEVADELEQIRLSAWVPSMYNASPAVSHNSSSDFGSSFSGVSGKRVSSSVGSRRVVVPQRTADCLEPLAEGKDSSPVSVQDPWLSGQSSPSTNTLLGNVIQ